MSLEHPPASLVMYATAQHLWQVVVILEPLTVNVAKGFGVLIALVDTRRWLPDGVRPGSPVWYPMLPSAKVVAHSLHSSTEHDFSGPWRVLPRVERELAIQTCVIEIGMARPTSPRWPIMHVVMLVGIEREIDIWPLVLENVFETTPSCAIPSVLWPNKGFRCLHVSKFATILQPFTSYGAELSWTVSVFVVCFEKSLGEMRHFVCEVG